MGYKEWKKVKLNDVVSKLGDGLHGTPKYVSDGQYYFINGNNLVDGNIVIKKDTKRVEFDEYIKYKKELNDRTILLGINGTIGNVAVYNNEKCILGKSACYFNVISLVNKNFVKYVICDKSFQSYIQNVANGTTIKNVSLKSIREFEFYLPPLQAQNRIASILSSLDDKIELNRQTNQTLEVIAQTLFKEMCVPKSDELPKGWKIGKLGDVYVTTSGGTPSRAKMEYFENGIIPWIKSKELKNSFIITTEEKITKDALKNSSAKIIPMHSVVIAMYGATVGEIGITGMEATCNQAICAFISNEDYPFTFIYQFLKLNKANIISRAVGSAQQNISQELLKSIDIIIPLKQIIQEYHSIALPLFEQIKSNLEEIRTLTIIRDSLLPKLMKGELKL